MVKEELGKGQEAQREVRIKMNMWQSARYQSGWQGSGGEMRRLENTQRGGIKAEARGLERWLRG